MNFIRRFLDFIWAERLFQKKDHLLIAVSGGVDSSALVSLCASAGLTFSLAHCNFQLRGEESERDENFVKQLAEKYQTTLYLTRFDAATFASENKTSIQVAARHLRYNWFNKLIGGNWRSEFPDNDHVTTKVADLLLTAHHADDNIETSVLNFFKGSGISGVRGILPRQNGICRPLLFARKSELLEYARAENLEWVEDSSNSTEKYSRNRFRNSILPMIEEVYPGAAENLLDNIERFRDVETIYRESVASIISKLVQKDGQEIKIPVLRLRQLSAKKSICFEIIRQFNFSAGQSGEVLELLEAETGKFVESGTHRVIRHRNMLVIAEKAGEDTRTFVIEEHTRTIRYDQKMLEMTRIDPGEITDESSIAFLDADKISFPLILRKRRPSDYFYPLGMSKKKKLGRFLADKKLSTGDKEKLWVLEMDKKIIWVVGLRIDHRFRITPVTKNVLRIRVISTA